MELIFLLGRVDTMIKLWEEHEIFEICVYKSEKYKKKTDVDLQEKTNKTDNVRIT